MVLLANFTPVGFLLGKPLIHVYKFESSDRGFKDSEVPEKGKTLAMVEATFAKYKLNSSEPDIELRRTFRRHPLKFWEWYDYLTHDRWSYSNGNFSRHLSCARATCLALA